MKTKTDDTAWSGYDPTQGPPILKAVDDEVRHIYLDSKLNSLRQN